MDVRNSGVSARRRSATVEPETQDDRVASSDWWSSIRLAAVFSIVAGISTMVLTGRLPEITIIMSIIVIGTMVSWFHQEDTPTAALVRHQRRPRH
jgi:hypothetical protein